MSTVLERQRAANITDAQFVGLDLLLTRGAALRYRTGWGFGSLDGPVIAPATMDALFLRGLAARGHLRATVTKLGLATYNQIKGVTP